MSAVVSQPAVSAAHDFTGLVVWVARYGPKVGQIDPKCDKSGDYFQIRFSTFGSFESDLKKSLDLSHLG